MKKLLIFFLSLAPTLLAAQELTANTPAGEVGLTLADPGTAGVNFYGSLKITGRMIKYPTW